MEKEREFKEALFCASVCQSGKGSLASEALGLKDKRAPHHPHTHHEHSPTNASKDSDSLTPTVSRKVSSEIENTGPSALKSVYSPRKRPFALTRAVILPVAANTAGGLAAPGRPGWRGGGQ